MRSRLFVYSVLLALFPLLGYAEGGTFSWSKSNAQLLRAYDYEVGERQRTIVTLEHAHGHQYGDTLAWVDVIKPDGRDHSYYGEISPRLSLSKITGRDLSRSVIKDILISTTFEKAKGQGPQYLYGVAVDFKLPGFTFFKSNFYVHDSTELSGQTWQITLAWNRPFKIGTIRLLAEGFADFQGSEGGREPNELIVPRVLVDISRLIDAQQGKLMAGIEYQYWHNKFGIDGVTESVPQIQIKWTF